MRQYGPVLDVIDNLDSLQIQWIRAGKRVEELSRWVYEREYDYNRPHSKESHD